MIKAGELTQRINLQRDAGNSVDDYGQPQRLWGTYHTTWASVRPLSGREQEQGAARQAVISHRVRLRYKNGVLHGDRISMAGGRVLEIVSVRNIDEGSWELEIDAIERSA
jgi:SPP1 family predicted phage head-tail adaptor